MLKTTGRFSVMLLAGTALVACASIKPEPITDAENQARVESDMAVMFSDQEPMPAVVTLDEAIARTLKYNLDKRLKLMEEAVAARQLDATKMTLLPQMVASAGYTARDNNPGTINPDGSQSNSQERSYGTTGLSVSWNVLDFAIGWVRAHQQADSQLIVSERRRQVVQNIVQDVRSAYWRSAAAERLIGKIDPLLAQIRSALADSDKLASQKAQSPLETLTYQRTLLETVRQLEDLRRDMMTAKTELAALMNVRPGTPFSVAAASQPTPDKLLSFPVDGDRLETEALLNRTELRSETYQARIAAEEAKAAILKMIPGLNFSAGISNSTDDYLISDTWVHGGVDLSWNILNAVSGPANLRLARTEEDLSHTRRLALSMAVLSQVHIASLRFESSRHQFELAERLADIELAIRDQLDAQRKGASGSQLDLIQGETSLALADLRRDLAYAEMQAAWGGMFTTLGLDPLPESVAGGDLDSIKAAVRQVMAAWERGDIEQADTAPPASAAPAVPPQAAAAPEAAAPVAAVHAPVQPAITPVSAPVGNPVGARVQDSSPAAAAPAALFTASWPQPGEGMVVFDGAAKGL